MNAKLYTKQENVVHGDYDDSWDQVETVTYLEFAGAVFRKQTNQQDWRIQQSSDALNSVSFDDWQAACGFMFKAGGDVAKAIATMEEEGNEWPFEGQNIFKNSIALLKSV